MQNLPSRSGPYAKVLKNCVVPPDGYMIVDCDASQIEARVLAWFAEQNDLVEAFANREDVYKKMASSIYKIPVEEVNKQQRQVGKVAILGCFGPDTEVLTSSGWKSIVCVLDTDLLWDGEEWVTHAGVIYQGRKPTITQYGVTATADHEILVESGWEVWSEVCTKPHLFQSALRLAGSPCSDTNPNPTGQDALAGGIQFVGAVAGGRAMSIAKTSYEACRPGVTNARRLRQTKSGTGNTSTLVMMTRRVRACLIDWRHALAGATTRTTSSSITMGGVGLPCTGTGEKIGPHFSGTRVLFAGTMTRALRWIGLTSTKDMSRATFGLLPERPICGTSGLSEPCKSGYLNWKQRTPTYDIALAGPRNRFTIRTSEGPVIAHNCGYGVGGAKFKNVLKLMGGVDVDEDEAKRIVTLYRETNPKIQQLWWDAGSALERMVQGKNKQFGREGVVRVDHAENAIWLPSGLPILYPDLRVKRSDNRAEYSYKGRGKSRNYIYGGKCAENLTQALARCIIAEQMYIIQQRYRVALTVHDSVVVIVPEAEIVEGTRYIMGCMRHLPDWAEGLPIDCEAEVGYTYGNLTEFEKWLTNREQ